MPSPLSSAVEQVLAQDADWISPFLWRSEFRNALTGALRRRLITLDAALNAIVKAENAMTGREFHVSSRAVLRLAAESSCSAYDCEFVALAEDQDIPLLTVDRQILRDFPRRAISLEKFVGR
jgi:predicted nucleic acid-binding protein